MTSRTRGKQTNFRKLLSTDISVSETRREIQRRVLPGIYGIKRIIRSRKNGKVSDLKRKGGGGMNHSNLAGALESYSFVLMKNKDLNFQTL